MAGSAQDVEVTTASSEDADERSTLAGRPHGVSAGRAAAIERYTRGPLLGAGAMGSVHECEDHALEREVAVKIIRPALAESHAMRARFVREAKIQGKLEHPGVVPVHDFGFDAEGMPYFAMKRVRGRSLRSVLRGEGDDRGARHTQRRLLVAFSTVCLTVAFVHSKGVVHRDIKPSNVMLGDFGEVYLLDWGIAKDGAEPVAAADETQRMAEARDAAEAGVTSAGDVLGTLGYMAPEQVRGERVDTQADVYALGAVLFEILAREPLHRGSEGERIARTVHGADARPSRRAPKATIPPELDDLCVRATALDPAERPTAREMHEVIERVLDGVRHDETSRARSAEHVAHARAAIARLDAEPRARERATQELHRALVLDPTNAEALELLRRLASERPVEDDIAAAEQVDASASRAHRLLARVLAALFVPWIASITLVLATHAKDRLVLGLLLGTIVVTAALIAWRGYSRAIGLVYAALATGLTACALMSAVFGPFILVPTMLSVTGVIFGLTASSTGKLRVRRFAQIGAVLAFTVPLLLELAGVLPPSYEIRDGGLFIFARAADFLPAGETIRYLVGFNVVLIVVPGIVVERLRRHEIAVERRAFRAAARMSRMLPNAARVADLAIGPEEGGAPPS